MLNDTIRKLNLIYYGLMIILKEKKYYDLYIGTYIEKTKKIISNSNQNDESDIFLSKINEILNVMSNLEFKENINAIIDEKLIKNLFAYIDNIIYNYIIDEYNDNIEKVFEEISNFFTSKKGLLELSKKNIKDFCHKYLNQCILHYIYDYFIIDIIPQISFNIYNKKIEKYLKKMSKNENRKIDKNNINYFVYL